MNIPLPWTKPPITSNRTRGNPYARAAEVKTAKAQAAAAIRAADTHPIVGANLTLHYRPDTRRRRDADGLYPTYKVVSDALVEAGVLPDDSWVCVPRAACHIHEPAKPALMWLEIDTIREYDAKERP